MNNLWALATIIGPILLAAAILWALMRNRKHDTPQEVARTEAATHQLYEQEHADEVARENRVER